MAGAEVFLQHPLKATNLRPGPDPARAKCRHHLRDLEFLDHGATEDKKLISHVRAPVSLTANRSGQARLQDCRAWLQAHAVGPVR